MSKKVSKALQAMDFYGAPINLTYGGDTSHKTVAGGILTVLGVILTVSYLS